MPDRVTVTVPANHLPEEVRVKLRERPIPGTRYRVTAEPIEETEEEKLAALRTHVENAMNDPRPSIPGETVFAEARARIIGKRRTRLDKGA